MVRYNVTEASRLGAREKANVLGQGRLQRLSRGMLAEARLAIRRFSDEESGSADVLVGM